jgi:hypothetical protein
MAGEEDEGTGLTNLMVPSTIFCYAERAGVPAVITMDIGRFRGRTGRHRIGLLAVIAGVAIYRQFDRGQWSKVELRIARQP